MPILIKLALLLWLTTFLLHICVSILAEGVKRNPKSFSQKDMNLLTILVEILAWCICGSIGLVLPVAIWFIFLN